MIYTYLQVDMQVGCMCGEDRSLSSLLLWEFRLNDFMCLEAAVKIKDIESSYWYLDEEEHSQN